MPPPEEKSADLQQIRDAVSKISGALKRSTPTDESSEKLEARFLEDLSEKSSRITSLEMQDLARQIGIRHKFHALNSAIEIHDFRKKFLWFLLILVFVWLLVVVAIVGWNAASPSIDDRIKLLSAQTEFFKTNPQLNKLYLFQFKTICPNFCSTLFHLSDSVLIAFITSTTVAVLGLFLTAAKWLYNDHQKSDAETELAKNADSN